MMIELEALNCYWHTLERPGKGLAYCGITLIPPQSMHGFLRILSSKNQKAYIPLIALFNEAKGNNEYIIHFGI